MSLEELEERIATLELLIQRQADMIRRLMGKIK